MEQITSTKNAIVKKLQSLRDKKGRAEHARMLVEGEKLVLEALRENLACDVVLMEESFLPRLAPVLAEKGIAVFTVPRHIIESISDTKTPQGVCGAFALPEMFTLDNAPERIVALDGVQDPGNVGTIWRTADAAGFTGILFGAGSADRLSTKVQRATMGSGLRLRAMETDDLADTLRRFREMGYTVYASSLQGDDFYSRPQGSGRSILVIGNEARGISQQVADAADVLVKLPMRGGAESLNASVAAGIMMYEMMRG